jgi:hypothetical protein
VAAKKYQEAIDSIMQVCLDPRKGLTDENLETIPNETGLFEEWFGVNAGSFALFAGLMIAGASLVGYGTLKTGVRR